MCTCCTHGAPSIRHGRGGRRRWFGGTRKPVAVQHDSFCDGGDGEDTHLARWGPSYAMRYRSVPGVSSVDPVRTPVPTTAAAQDDDRLRRWFQVAGIDARVPLVGSASRLESTTGIYAICIHLRSCARHQPPAPQQLAVEQPERAGNAAATMRLLERRGPTSEFGFERGVFGVSWYRALVKPDTCLSVGWMRGSPHVHDREARTAPVCRELFLWPVLDWAYPR